MTNNIPQSSFACGEVSPEMYGRFDTTKYHNALALMLNWFVDIRGGASTRPGTQFIAQARNSVYPVRVIPFQFSTTQDYVLEFGHLYMRVYVEGEQVLEEPKTINNITKADPGVVNVPGHGYITGDEVVITGAIGMTQVNGRNFLIGAAGPNNFQINDLNNNPINTAVYGVYAGGGSIARVYTLTTPYAGNDLALLKYAQSADVMTLTHISYPPADLKRFSDTNWTLTNVTFAPSIQAPVVNTITPSASGTTQYSYVVTSVSESTQEESLPSPAITTTTSQAMSQTPAGATVTVEWTDVPGASQYNVYRQIEVINGHPADSALYGFVGTSVQAQGDQSIHQFVDVNISPDFTQVPATLQQPFVGVNNYPGCVCYFQQRKVFGDTNMLPQTVYFTQPGAYTNMNTTIISRASDAITATLSSNQVNAIQWLIPFSSLVALTNSGAWQITGGSGEASEITPSTISAQPQAYNGSSIQVKPLVINYDILYVPYLGAGVFDLSYNLILQSFYGDDISVLSNHLFYNYTITDWCYQETPLKAIWMVRGDGTLLSLTYMKTQDIQGYSQHTTQGFYRSVCSVIEQGQNASNVLYAVVERFFPGVGYVKYIERFANRIYANNDASVAWCVDAGLQYPLNYPDSKLQADPLADVTTVGNVVQFASSVPLFASYNVGDAIRASHGKAIITQYISPTVVEAQITVPMRNNYTYLSGAWSFTAPVASVSGLDHLNGLTVTGLADGGVIPPVVVENGTVTLPGPSTDIIIGLPYECDLQTLPIDTGAPSIQGKRKKINAVTARQMNSRGLSVGSTFDTLREWKQRNRGVLAGQAIPLLQNDARIVMDPSWQEPGSMCIRQSYPLPATITALIPEIIVGDEA